MVLTPGAPGTTEASNVSLELAADDTSTITKSGSGGEWSVCDLTTGLEYSAAVISGRLNHVQIHVDLKRTTVVFVSPLRPDVACGDLQLPESAWLPLENYN